MLNPADRDRLLKMLRLLDSDQVGERAAAGAAAMRLLHAAGASWDQVIASGQNPRTDPEPEPKQEAPSRSDVDWLDQRYSLLTPWERGFVSSVRRRRALTGRQIAKLRQITADVLLREVGR